jgi:ferredoxin
VRIVIDPAVCQGHLRCADRAPELFDADDQGHGVAVDRPLQTEAELSAAKLAVAGCPEGAIRLVG